MPECEYPCDKPISRLWICALFNQDFSFNCGVIVDSGVTLDPEIIKPQTQAEYDMVQATTWIVSARLKLMKVGGVYGNTLPLHTDQEEGLFHGRKLSEEETKELSYEGFVRFAPGERLMN